MRVHPSWHLSHCHGDTRVRGSDFFLYGFREHCAKQGVAVLVSLSEEHPKIPLCESWVSVETPVFRRYLNCDMSTKESCIQSGTRPAERCLMLSAKLEGLSHVIPLTEDIDLQYLMFFLLYFALAMLSFSSFRPSCLWNGNICSVLLYDGSI